VLSSDRCHHKTCHFAWLLHSALQIVAPPPSLTRHIASIASISIKALHTYAVPFITAAAAAAAVAVAVAAAAAAAAAAITTLQSLTPPQQGIAPASVGVRCLAAAWLA
jgi:hypothetical protein